MRSPKQTARIAGLFYLLLAFTGIFGLLYVPSEIMVHGDASATAQNIRSSNFLFKTGILANILGQISFLFLGIVLYKLFKVVNKGFALTLLVLVAVSVPITFMGIVSQVGALMMADQNTFNAFQPDQLDSLSMMFLSLYERTIGVVVIFWGLWLFPFGYLVYKSGFLPKIIGVFLMIGCFGYITDFAFYLYYPDRPEVITNILSGISSLGEFSILFWLLIKGVNVEKYNKKLDPQ